MAKDPYEDISQEELEASGATDWFSDTLAEQRKANAKLKSSLSQDTGSIKARKNQLQDLLELPPDLDPEEPAPDLFAAERAAAGKENSSLSSLMGDLKDNRAADKDLLKDLFGK